MTIAQLTLNGRRTRIVVDSSSTIPPDLVAQYGMIEVPTLVNFGADSFRNNIDLSPAQFYARIAEGGPWPTTSQPPPAYFADAYRQAFAEGAEHIFLCTVSGKFSGTFQSAQRAATEFGLERFTLWDSDSASMGSGYQAMLAARLMAEGVDEARLLDYLGQIRAVTVAYGTVESLKYAARSGRLSNFQAGVGDLLQVKAIFEVVQGRFSAIGRVRGRQRSLRAIVERFWQDVGDRHVRIAIAHANAPLEAQQVAADVQDRLNVRELHIVEIGPVIATLAGPGLVAVAGHPVQ
jgi:DegV family protein with EDD domain